jgi:hypothetical protein
MAFLSDYWGLICQLMIDNRERNKQIVLVKQDPVDLEIVINFVSCLSNFPSCILSYMISDVVFMVWFHIYVILFNKKYYY